MTPPAFFFAFRLTCLLLGGVAGGAGAGPSALRPLTAAVGEDVTMPCLYEHATVTVFNWYRQTLGQRPELMSYFYKHEKNGSFVGEFKNNLRLGLGTGAGKNHLKISNAQYSDSAIYYCTTTYLSVFEFAEGYLLSVNGAGWGIHTSVRRLRTNHPGPTALSCAVSMGGCDQPVRVHWFKRSGADPGMIYTHEGAEQRCLGNATARTCVYDLPMEDPADAGTYYCAVASCGRILFGNGAELEREGSRPVLVYVLSGALGLAAILMVFLAYTTYTLRRTLKRQCNRPQTAPLDPSVPNAEEEEGLHYAALSEQRVSRKRKHRDVSAECVYSGVKQ